MNMTSKKMAQANEQTNSIQVLKTSEALDWNSKTIKLSDKMFLTYLNTLI
jgi:hypothetical protein